MMMTQLAYLAHSTVSRRHAAVSHQLRQVCGFYDQLKAEGDRN